MSCVSDADQTLISYGAPVKGGTSTKNLLVPGFPDELRMQTGVAPRIVTASIKDYTATTLAGRRERAAEPGLDAAPACLDGHPSPQV